MKARLASAGSALEVLWPAGLALLQLRLVDRWIAPGGERYDWTQYLLLGLGFLGALLL